jgi:predicted SprT family Zn-dependent metalloprotease
MFKVVSDSSPILAELERAAEVSKLARQLMDEHGLHDWTFQLSKTLNAFGYCWYIKQLIEISEHFVLSDMEKIRDTILHEIAHALAYKEYGSAGKGHGFYWKHVCRRIGADPERCWSDDDPGIVMSKPYQWKLSCPTCGRFWLRHRLRERTARGRCPDCKTTVVVEEGSFER